MLHSRVYDQLLGDLVRVHLDARELGEMILDAMPYSSSADFIAIKTEDSSVARRLNLTTPERNRLRHALDFASERAAKREREERKGGEQ